jgi:hypothetical protein
MRVALLGLMFWLAIGNALASPGSLNAGVKYCNSFIGLLPQAAKGYAITGDRPLGFRPKHSRAWYATALGLKDVLNKLLTKKPSLVRNKRLLRMAATTKDSVSLQVLLSHGADPNATIKSTTSPTSPPLLFFATECRRLVNMVYLLAAGANIYATDTQGANVMSVASVGGPSAELGPFEKGIVLLLAAGYDPRCPMAPGVTELSDAKYALANYEREISGMKNLKPATIERGVKLKDVVTILQGVEAIRKIRSPGPPHCNTRIKGVNGIGLD